MRHLNRVTVSKAMVSAEKQDDIAGIIFLQLWFTVVTLMLTAAKD